MTSNRVLFSSVCKPIGPSVGDAESVGYELLHAQVTRSQHIYSPRVTHVQYALDYIAENIDAPSVVLHYPSKRRFVRELRKGYDVVAIGFALPTVHHALDMCRLVREHAPDTRIVLGGYGTVISDEELLPHCDAICREEGVGFMRRYLGEPEIPLESCRHPDIRSRIRLFGLPLGHTAMIFAGLGCPNGCDFCCTSHFFKRRHIRLLRSGSAIFDVMAGLQDKHPGVSFTVLDEDFLLNRRRATEFLDRCRQTGRVFNTFCFASVKALSQYTCDELLEMGVEGVWIGYEGKQSGYSKHDGEDIDALIRKLQDHGITVLASMIVGIPYQTREIAEAEFKGLQANRPGLCQFLIYAPILGTRFYDRVMEEGLMHEDLANDRARYYRQATGFTAMVRHPHLERSEIEDLQTELYERDFKESGPSVLRVPEVKLNGWLAYRDHPNPVLRKKARSFRARAGASLALLPVGIFGPRITLRNRLRYVRQFLRTFRHAGWTGRVLTLAAPFAGLLAGITWLKIALGIRIHPFTRTHVHKGRQAWMKPQKRLGIVRMAAYLSQNGHARPSVDATRPAHPEEA